jgi:RimJ/RimL family protein N-acetyltransferase
VTPRVAVVQLSPEALRALADGDQAAAERAASMSLSPYLVGPECRPVWRVRAVQTVEDPPSAAWVTGVVWEPQLGLAVGRAGYHGPPDAAGMVEVGYSIDPQYRRRGYARAALLWLLDRAATEPDVSTVRATVSPDNEASRNLVLSEGFTAVGEQWDEEDGLEIVYEVAAAGGPPTP